MIRFRSIRALCAVVPLLGGPAAAGDQARPNSIAVYSGFYSVLQRDVPSVGQLGAEYRFGWRESFPWKFDRLGVHVGALTEADDSFYLYAGLQYDVELSRRWRLTPQASAGYYEAGDTLDLGSVLEFRSGVEVSVELTPTSRVALSYHHLSNSGLASDNPGVETLSLGWLWTPSPGGERRLF